MSIPGAASPLFLATTGAAEAFEISRSLRFNSADSAYLSRTPSSAGNRKTWTWSAWVKRSKLNGARRTLFRTNSSQTHISFSESAQGNPESIMIYWGSGYILTDAVFRDPSAWYHIVLAFDTTQATANDRVKLYINGERLEDFNSGNRPSQNYEAGINATNAHGLGANSSGGELHDGYLAEVNFCDGTAYDPTSFGAFDDNGVWQAIDTAGLTFGTNGFRLKFADNSSDAALGTDSSGNSNTWTVNNLTAQSHLYSSGVSGYINSLPSNSGASIFDGNTSNNFLSSNISGSGIKFAPPIAITGSIELYLRNGDIHNSQMAYSLDGGSNFTNVTTVGGGGSYVSIGSQTITTTNGIIVRHITTAGTNSVNWRAIKVDGTVLVDGTPSNTDSLVDSPTNGDTASDTGAGGQITGNYATWNPLDNGGNTLKDGNLVINGADKNCKSTIAVSSGKWYFEQTGRTSPGIALASTSAAANTDNYQYQYDGNLYHLSGGSYTTTSGGASFGEGDIIGVALDLDNNQLKLYKNGALQSALTKTIAAGTYCFMARSFFNTDHPSNFGQRAFAYAAPSGYKSLNTANLPTPTIADGSKYFDTKLWTGNGGTQSITGLNFSPDFAWGKKRNGSTYHNLVDIVRGANKELYSNDTLAETTPVTPGLTAFNSNGFDLGANSGWNANSDSYVGWAWDAGTSTVTNNDGSIASQVRANPSAGFSIVGWNTGGSTSNFTVGHGLNAKPSMFIIKNRDSAQDWDTYFDGFASNEAIYLNKTDAKTNVGVTVWNSVTSSVLGLRGASFGGSDSRIAYCFAPVAGYSAMGSYTGNGSADGPFVYTGFKIAWLMVKRSSSAGTPWQIQDATRSPFNDAKHVLMANENWAEASSNDNMDLLSNGFKPRRGSGYYNQNGGTYVYLAFASNPFQANGGLAR